MTRSLPSTLRFPLTESRYRRCRFCSIRTFELWDDGYGIPRCSECSATTCVDCCFLHSPAQFHPPSKKAC